VQWSLLVLLVLLLVLLVLLMLLPHSSLVSGGASVHTNTGLKVSSMF
jgi:hypothetical protein